MQGQPRRYRLLEAHLGTVETKAGQVVWKRMCSEAPWLVLPEACRTCTQRHLAFTLLSRCIAGMFMLLRLPHTGLPYALFGLLHQDAAVAAETAAKLQATPRCMADSFSDDFLRCHATHAQILLTPDVVATLGAIATLSKTEISGVEIGHARWQQDSQIRSVRTHRDALACTSANFVLFQAKQIMGHPAQKCLKRKKKQFRAAKRKRPWQSNALETRRQAHGGGGAYRAFVRQKCKGKAKPSPQVLAALKEEYVALAPDQREALAVAGEAMTLFGAPPQASVDTPVACSLEAGQEAVHKHNLESNYIVSKRLQKGSVIPTIFQSPDKPAADLSAWCGERACDQGSSRSCFSR